MHPALTALTDEERALHTASQEHLVPGQYYLFDPPVQASAVPVDNLNRSDAMICYFHRGCFIDVIEGICRFRGKPVDDQRDIADSLRDCYFPVLFVGGSQFSVDPDQGPH